MQDHVHIIHQHGQGIPRHGAAAHAQHRAVPEFSEFFLQFGKFPPFFGAYGYLRLFQFSGEVQNPSHIGKAGQIGLHLPFLLHIREHIHEKDEKEKCYSGRRGYDHQADGKKKQQVHHHSPGAVSFSQPVQIAQIIIDGILSASSQTAEKDLKIFPLLFMGRKPGNFLLHSFQLRLLLFAQGRRSERIIQILLSRRGIGMVHLKKDLIHSQIVPGDVIDLILPSVRFIKARNAGKFLILVNPVPCVSEGGVDLLPLPPLFSLFLTHSSDKEKHHRQGDGSQYCHNFHRFDSFRAFRTAACTGISSAKSFSACPNRRPPFFLFSLPPHSSRSCR